jgi:peptidoglycan/LPS O-acetylase OafA/YrhL
MESEHADAAAPVDVYHVGEGRCLVWDAPGACSLYYDYFIVISLFFILSVD